MDKIKKFGVFGLGISGVSTMKYLAKQNIDFIAYDDLENTRISIINKYPNFANNIKDLSNAAWQKIDYLIASPGISLNYPKPHKVVEIAKSINAKIICDIELFYLNNKDAYYIGITGTNGKSTTSSLITHILKYNNVNVSLGGNIGIPVLDIEPIGENKVFIFEVSSFQLDLLDKTKFDIAVLLNITPDHLDRHGNMENYTKLKYKIFNHQTGKDHAILNVNLPSVPNSFLFSEGEKADLTINNDILYYREQEYQLPKNNSLLGKHNWQNLSAAFACCLKYGLSVNQIIAALPSFVGLKHRMQYLGVYRDITFVNDSKATNADSTEKALASFDNIIWIVGGVQKEGGIMSLKEYFPKIKKALLIGKSQDSFAEILGDLTAWEKCDNLDNAFALACKIAAPNDVVLLSPACASYDQWKNFEERGDAFISLFDKLK